MLLAYGWEKRGAQSSRKELVDLILMSSPRQAHIRGRARHTSSSRDVGSCGDCVARGRSTSRSALQKLGRHEQHLLWDDLYCQHPEPGTSRCECQISEKRLWDDCEPAAPCVAEGACRWCQALLTTFDLVRSTSSEPKTSEGLNFETAQHRSATAAEVICILPNHVAVILQASPLNANTSAPPPSPR